jgi:transposase-like protein
MLQVTLEQEVEEFLGRAHYRQGKRRRQGWRNGYEGGKVKTAGGCWKSLCPEFVRQRSLSTPAWLPLFREGSDALGRLVKEMHVRGLSTREVEGMFLDALGHKVLSRSGVSRIAPRLQADFDSWRRRDLSELKLIYLLLDAIYLALRQGTDEKKGVLCAYGILENGKKVLLHLRPGKPGEL